MFLVGSSIFYSCTLRDDNIGTRIKATMYSSGRTVSGAKGSLHNSGPDAATGINAIASKTSGSDGVIQFGSLEAKRVYYFRAEYTNSSGTKRSDYTVVTPRENEVVDLGPFSF